MKALNRILILVLLLSPLFSKSQNVPQMQIVQLNMPLLPGDTAYEANLYPVLFSVQNVSPVSVVFDTLYIFGYNNDTSILQQQFAFIDTIISNLSQGIVIQVANPFYQFSSLNYKAGGNIVVVWPRLGNNPLTTYDSITVNIYFIPFQAAIAPEEDHSVQGILLNPAMNAIQFKTTGGFMPERVRIYDATGRICFSSGQTTGMLQLPPLAGGPYIIEWKNPNGRFARLKFVWP